MRPLISNKARLPNRKSKAIKEPLLLSILPSFFGAIVYYKKRGKSISEKNKKPAWLVFMRIFV
jgi:hypothetical protein